VIVSLKVKPGSKIDQFSIDAAGQLTVKLKAPAQDGRANAYLIELLARELRVAKSTITITAGFTSPHKRLEIDVSAGNYNQFLTRIKK
jgi:uncharacterized protein (TIGR00251 family)